MRKLFKYQTIVESSKIMKIIYVKQKVLTLEK